MMGVAAGVASKERGYWSNEEGRVLKPCPILWLSPLYTRIVTEQHGKVATLENQKKMLVIASSKYCIERSNKLELNAHVGGEPAIVIKLL